MSDDNNDDPYFTPDPPSRRVNASDRVRQIAARASISPDIADDYLKTTQIESGSNVNVRPSSKGALGFGQVMPDVKGGSIRTVGGKQYNLKDPDQNIEAGLRYFAEGGSDPTSRRLYYFGGPKAKAHYENTGQIPNISDGNMTAAQYVRATGGPMPNAPIRQSKYFTPQPALEADPYFTPDPSTPQGRGAAMADNASSGMQGGPPLTSNDAAWHFGEGIDPSKLSRRARATLQEAVAEDQRKKAAGEPIAPPPLSYQNDMRVKAGLGSLVSGGLTGVKSTPEVQGEASYTDADRLRNVVRATAPPGFGLLPNAAQEAIGEQVAKGAGGIARLAAGVVRSVPHDPFPGQNQITDQVANKINAVSENIGRGAQQMEKQANRPTVRVPVLGDVGMQDVYNVGGGAISSAPAMILTSLGVPAPVAFGLQSYLEATGRDAEWKDVLKETGVGASTGALFEIPLPAKMALLAKIGAKLGIVGGGTYGIEKIAGMPEAEARKNAAVNALFAVSGAEKERSEVSVPTQTVPEAMQGRVRLGDIAEQAKQVGATVLNPEEVIVGGKPKIRLREVANAGTSIQDRITQPVSGIANELLPGTQESGRPARPISSPLVATTEGVNPDVAGAAGTSQRPMAERPAIASEGRGAGETVTSEPAVRHVDLQPRRVRGEGKGQFKEETKAQREARLAQVNPEQSNTVVPAAPVEASAKESLAPQTEITTPLLAREPSVKSIPAATQAEKPATTGIAQRVEESRRSVLGDESPQPGEGVTAQDSVERGRQLLSEGKSPEEAVVEFQRTGAISSDAMALVRAKHEELARAANKAFDEGGQNLNDPKFQAAEKARQDFWEKSVKPMQTEWHKTGMVQQGETDIDSGTFYGLYRAFKDQAGREMTTREESAAKNLSARVAAKESSVQEANRALIDALNKATGIKDLDPDVQKALSKFVEESRRETRTQKRQQTRKTLDEEAALIKSNIVAEFARLKSQSGKGATLSQQGLGLLDPEGVITRELVKYAKNRVKAGITDTAQLIDDTHAFIKDFADVSRRQVAEALTGVTSREKREPSEWMNVKGEIKEGLKAEDAAQGLKDLGSRVISGKVSPEDPKALWRYATDKYIDKGVEYGDAVQKVAADLGATPEQVRRVLATKANMKPLEAAAYERMSARRQAKTAAEQWLRNADRSPALKAAQGASDAFFNLATFGHGTVGPVTHAAENIFHPTRWADYFKNVGRTWKAAYSSAAHERYMQDLVNDPNYTTARRAGLANEPGKFYDEYQNNLAQKMFGSIGKIGNRGFDVLKRMRQDFFNQRWAKLDESQKTPEMAKVIADLVNHSTGAIRTKLPHAGLARGVFFAAPLELSRWARILGDPVRAGDTFTNWKSASPSEKYFAKSVVKNHAGFLATYLGALALNQAVLTASDSKDKVNFTDPSKSDWLRFKVKGRTLDLSGGVIGTMGFLGRLGQAAFGAQNPREGRFERIGKASADYARGKLSPIASVGTDVVTQSDFRGRPMPFSSDKEKEGRPRYSWPEYLVSRTSPIPVSEGARDFFDEMHKQGVPVDTTRAIFNAAVNHPMSIAKGAGIGAVSGSTGVRIGAEFVEKNASGKLVGSKGNDPLAKELIRLGKQVNGTAKDKDESQSQYEKRRDYVNKEIEADLKSLIDTREYKRLSEPDKKQQITMHLMNVTKQSNENYRLQNNLSKPPVLRQVYIESPRTVAP